MHDFSKAVDNSIRAFFPFNDAVIASFWYFNNIIFSVVTPLAFDNDNIALIQIFRWQFSPEFCFSYIFFCVEVKMDSYTKVFIENQLPSKNSQIHGSVRVHLINQNKDGKFFFRATLHYISATSWY